MLSAGAERPFTLGDVVVRRERLAPYVVTTPVHRLPAGDWHPASELHLKLEHLQRSGSFKVRGAGSVMLALTPEQRATGVVCVSGGNHALAVAHLGAALGTSVVAVMPATASPARRRRCVATGIRVEPARDAAEAFRVGERIQRAEARTLVHPFEGRLTALGNATLAVEWLDQMPDLEAVVIAVGGGGLLAGVAAGVKLRAPSIRVYGVEPEGADTLTRSFARGRPTARQDPATIADSLIAPAAMPYSFGLCRRHVDGLATVTDGEIIHAMALLVHHAGLAVEPAGAVALAGTIGPLAAKLAGRRVGVLVCGSNTDAETFTRHLADA